MAKHTDYPVSWLTLRQQRRGIVKMDALPVLLHPAGHSYCQGIIRPTALSRKYVVKISYPTWISAHDKCRCPRAPKAFRLGPYSAHPP